MSQTLNDTSSSSFRPNAVGRMFSRCGLRLRRFLALRAAVVHMRGVSYYVAQYQHDTTYTSIICECNKIVDLFFNNLQKSQNDVKKRRLTINARCAAKPVFARCKTGVERERLSRFGKKMRGYTGVARAHRFQMADAESARQSRNSSSVMPPPPVETWM